MSERWRKPVIIAAIEASGDENDETVVLQDSDDLQRIREGYVCPNCFEPFEVPFPVTCPLCAYPVRAEAATNLERHYKGKVWVGSRISIDDELSELEERDERKNFKPGASIVVPRGVNLDD